MIVTTKPNMTVEDLSDFFLKAVNVSEPVSKSLEIEAGAIVFDIDDSLIVKIIESLVVDFPTS